MRIVTTSGAAGSARRSAFQQVERRVVAADDHQQAALARLGYDDEVDGEGARRRRIVLLLMTVDGAGLGELDQTRALERQHMVTIQAGCLPKRTPSCVSVAGAGEVFAPRRFTRRPRRFTARPPMGYSCGSAVTPRVGVGGMRPWDAASAA